MRVKILQTHTYGELEEIINKFLSTHDNEDVIDIKYSGVGNHSPYSSDYYSAMIILKCWYKQGVNKIWNLKLNIR